MYEESARLYDAIYRAIGKDYVRETEEIQEIVNRDKLSDGNRLLDVACGTGLHLKQLKEVYQVEGLDRSPGMLDIARQRCPDVRFHHADMISFDLGSKFDVVTCLFSSIGYMKSVDELRRALTSFARHLVPGGVVIVEPWLHPDVYRSGRPFITVVDEPELKIARLNVSKQKGRLALLRFHYLVATTEDVEHFTEYHELGLFSHEEYLEAFRAAGLEPRYQEEGLMGRGIYSGVLPRG
jgi:ubiquinone/menaquinone biosynthesis C-methylase UbiE